MCVNVWRFLFIIRFLNTFEYLNGTEPIYDTFYVIWNSIQFVNFHFKQSTKNFRSFFLALAITQCENKITTNWMNEWTSIRANAGRAHERWNEQNGFSVPLSSFTVNEYYWPLSLSSPEKKICGFICVQARVRPLFFYCSFVRSLFRNDGKKNRCRWTRNISPCLCFFLECTDTGTVPNIKINVLPKVCVWMTNSSA